MKRRGRQAGRLSPAALGRLTWTGADRKAWQDAYRAALRIDARRHLQPRKEIRHDPRTGMVLAVNVYPAGYITARETMEREG